MGSTCYLLSVPDVVNVERAFCWDWSYLKKLSLTWIIVCVSQFIAIFKLLLLKTKIVPAIAPWVQTLSNLWEPSVDLLFMQHIKLSGLSPLINKILRRL